MKKLFAVMLVFCLMALVWFAGSKAMADNTPVEVQPQEQPTTVSGIDHVILVWFENKESTSITAATAPYFDSFATSNVR